MSEWERILNLVDDYHPKVMHLAWADISPALHAECADRATQISRLLHDEADYWTRWARWHTSPGDRW